MPRRIFSSSVFSVFLASTLLATVSAAIAQNAPPIKPGLWEFKLQTEGMGNQMPDMGDRLKNLPPEQRAQVEAMMKQKGISMGGGGGAGGITVKQCLDADSLAKGQWLKSGSQEHREGDRCRSDVTDRSGGVWKFHVVCTDPDRVSEGEANFSNPEGYTLKITNTSTDQGAPRVSHIALNATWLGESCGEQKP